MADFSDVLLTVDFDRTLTAPDSTIPERNLEAIRYFMDNGGAFTVNTGRSIPMFSSLMDVIPVNAPLLLYNGSAAYDTRTGELTFAHEIALDWRRAIRRAMELLPEMLVEVQGLHHHYLLEENEMWAEFCRENHCPYAFASLEDDLGVFLKFAVYGKLHDATVSQLFAGTPEELAQVDRAVEVLRQEFGDKISIFRSAPRILDIHAAGVSKGRSARQLQRALGRKTLVCVGDAENDLSMLLEADFAYCPADGVVADRFENVCQCASGAVADVIYKKIPQIPG